MASHFLKFSVLVQKYRTPLFVAGCSVVFTADIFYHVFPETTYRKLYQAWSKGAPTTLSEKLKDVFVQVLKDSAVGSPGSYTAFAAYGFHPVGAGIPWLPSGAHIGIPSNFNSTPDEPSGITDRTILINGKEVDWDSETGNTLRNALVVSEDAQKFAVAREVARLKCAGPILHAAVAPTCLAGAWIYSVALKQIFGLFARSVILRAGVNALALGLGAVSYFLASDTVNQRLEFYSDRRAASLSKSYAKGGVEFYEKILLRNQTLRLLMGPKGAEMYTPSGNLFPASLMSMKHAPYTARRDRILSLLKDEKE
ncbi:transmembrane protein 177 [Silurus asotus]|uniref:Transmembrane protein 177 n=1 Tax=Silurus asotus TaxID=30991 RepID=A0AAD5B4V1_SILAS|nr:transmembrane protein 177 [Silurus asotus]